MVNYIRLMGPAALIALCGLTGVVLIDPAEAQRPRPIPAGDCRSMVAATGGKGIWYGEYSGRTEDEWGWVYPLAGRGCFRSKYECVRWLNQMLSVGNGWSAVQRCRPYNKRR